MIHLKNFKMNEEGAFSITRPFESRQIVKIMKEVCKPSKLNSMIITDATACVGGDLVHFSKEFLYVNGVEMNKDNYDCLVENIEHFGCKNVNLFCQNYLDIFRRLKQDIIYMDPPWGGVEYKQKKEIVLKLDDVPVHELIETIKQERLARYIFIKAPMNVWLDESMNKHVRTIYHYNKLESFKLIIIRV